MAENKQFLLKKDSEQSVITYTQKAHELLLNQFSMRTNLELIDRYYMRECDWTTENYKARIANRLGDKRKMQDVTVPIIMPQVESALAYMANAFLTGYPIFGVSSDPATEDAALQMSTIIAENAITAGWVRQLMMFFRDGLKYNLHGVECVWQQRNVATVETDINSPNNARPKTTIWQGNVLKRMDLYNTFFDPRVHPAEIHTEGEFAGYMELYSRVRLKKLINELYGKIPAATAIRAFESGPSPVAAGGSGNPFAYYTPLINPYPIMNRSSAQGFDWMQWALNSKDPLSQGLRYKNIYEVTTLYARILPSDFGMHVPEENTPQVWKFLIVNGQVVLFAERQTNAHNFLPIFFGQPLEDGLDYQTKSFASNVMDMQDIASSMWNGYMASKRRLVGDRVLYDPLRVREKDINSTNPAAKIPVRPTAYGKPVGEAVYQFPFRDEQTNSLLEGSDAVVRFANLINNQNPAQQGQFVKGNKTLHEYEDVMGHGNGHNQCMGIMAEAQVFTPMKECVKLNILQFQPSDVIYNREENQQVTIKPEDLRKAAVHFKVSDGMSPEDKQMSTDEFQTALQVIGSSPQLSNGYNIAPLVTYMFKLRGADLRPFEKSQLQQTLEQQQQQLMGVLQMAAEKGTQLPPEIGKQLQQIQQQLQQIAQQSPSPAPSATSTALEATQGNSGSSAATKQGVQQQQAPQQGGAPAQQGGK